MNNCVYLLYSLFDKLRLASPEGGKGGGKYVCDMMLGTSI